MADGSLTAKEFWRLSPEARMERYGELSDYEKLLVRISMPPAPISPPCNRCKHYFGYGKCRAFPDGLKADHVRVMMNDQTIECGNGFRFSPKE